MARSLAEASQEFFNLISKQGNVLLIYDSSDDLDVIEDVLPQSRTKVHVIVTTRCRDHTLMKEGQVIRLPPLTEDAATEAFLSWSGIKDKATSKVSESELQAARDIVNDVQVKVLPLAVRRVATYLKETRLTCRQLSSRLLEKQTLRYSPEGMEEMLKCYGLRHLLDKLKQKDIVRPQKFLATDLSNLQESGQITREEQQKLKKVQERIQFDMTTTLHWDLDLEEVSTQSELSMEILNFSSLMDSSAIPVDVLRKASSRDNQASDNEEFRRSFSLLLDGFSLISCDDDEDTCSVHALIQQSVLKRMEKLGSLSSHCVRLVPCLNDMIPQTYDAIRRNVSSKKVRPLLPHMYSLCGHILDSQCIGDDDVWHFLERSCWFAVQSHDISTAKQLAERKLNVFKQCPRVTNKRDATESKTFYYLYI